MYTDAYLTRFGKFLLLFLAVISIIACKDQTVAVSGNKLNTVKDSVTAMAHRVAGDISHRGPAAWLDYFDDSTGFFMASDGKIAFPDIDSAKQFIRNTLVKNIRSIQLEWAGLRIEPLTPTLANMGADFTEIITDASGNQLSIAGYFTGMAKLTSKGWKLHNAHWSILPSK